MHEGSLVMINMTFVLDMYHWSMSLAIVSSALAMLRMSSCAPLILYCSSSNPLTCTRHDFQQDAQLNLPLKDVGLISHPSLLYMEYMGLPVMLAFVIDGLLCRFRGFV